MKKILVVDDRREVRNLVEKTLGRCGHRILQAESGQEALAIALDQEPDLIIMDLMMPGAIDGMEAIRILKSDSRTSICKVVILTGREDAQTIQASMIAQADAWFLKPFSPLELLQKVEELLAQTFPRGST